MDAIKLIWIDFTRSTDDNPLPEGLCESCHVVRISNPACITETIQRTSPDVLCFEFGYPDSDDMVVLSQTKQDNPGIPILMVTEYHSEALAIWALRIRVWDFFVKPVTTEDLLRPVLVLQNIRKQQCRSGARQVVPCKSEIPAENQASQPRLHRAIFKAQCYVESHIDEKLTLTELARVSGMSPFYFSRSFKQVCGITFRDFVIKTRIQKATELLAKPGSSVTRVCYDVGFQDISNFSRTFRRYTGVNPTEFRQQRSKKASQ